MVFCHFRKRIFVPSHHNTIYSGLQRTSVGTEANFSSRVGDVMNTFNLS